MWKFQMKILLASGEAWDVVLGSALKPEPPRGTSRTRIPKKVEDMAENGQHSSETHHTERK